MSQYLHFGCLSPLRLEQRVAAAGGRGADDLPRASSPGATSTPTCCCTTRACRATRSGPRWTSSSGPTTPTRSTPGSEGRTGYPVVDAAMRQLVACGWMHNRARMIVASFLTKDLHLDWRLGERFFMEHLIDGDVGSNNGGWQWVAGTGTDPQDYTRVFNPSLQQERFDPDGALRAPLGAGAGATSPTRSWPSRGRLDEPPAGYPPPIVDHAVERRRAIEAYRAVRADAPGYAPRRARAKSSCTSGGAAASTSVPKAQSDGSRRSYQTGKRSPTRGIAARATESRSCGVPAPGRPRSARPPSRSGPAGRPGP